MKLAVIVVNVVPTAAGTSRLSCTDVRNPGAMREPFAVEGKGMGGEAGLMQRYSDRRTLLEASR